MFLSLNHCLSINKNSLNLKSCACALLSSLALFTLIWNERVGVILSSSEPSPIICNGRTLTSSFWHSLAKHPCFCHHFLYCLIFSHHPEFDIGSLKSGFRCVLQSLFNGRVVLAWVISSRTWTVEIPYLGTWHHWSYFWNFSLKRCSIS